MPDERQPEGAAREQHREDPFVPPDKIDDGVWSELFQRDQPAAPAKTEPTVDTDTTPAAPAAAPVDPTVAAQQAVSQMMPQIAAQIAALQGQGQTVAESRKSVEDTVVEDLVTAAGPGANQAAIREMVKTMVRVAQDQTAPKIAALEKQLADLTSAQSRAANDRILQNFEALIERRCAEAGIDKPFERSSMRALVVQEGMRLHGASFDLAKADRLFRQLNSERVKLRNEGKATMPETPATKATKEPAVKGSKGNASAVEGIRDGLSNPKKKGWGFRGRHFQDVVKQSLERALG